MEIELFSDCFGGFSTATWKTSITEPAIESSPPRKTARLSADPAVARARPHTGPVRLTLSGHDVKTFVAHPRDDSFGATTRAIKAVYSQNYHEQPKNLQAIYSACRAVVCVMGKGDDLYDVLKIETEKCITVLLAKIEGPVEDSKTKIAWVKEFVNICDWFEKQVALMKSMLSYLDQLYVRKNPGMKGIHDLAYSLFYTRVFKNQNTIQHLREGIEEWVNEERGYRVPHAERHVFIHLVRHLQTHGQYSMFETTYLDTTRAYYLTESQEMRDREDAEVAFVERLFLRAEEERQRCKSVLPVASWSAVQQTTETAFLEGRTVWLSGVVMKTSFKPENLGQLKEFYALFSRDDHLKDLCAAFKAQLTLEVAATVQNKTKAPKLDEDMIPKLLVLKALADKAVSTAFAETCYASGPSSSASLPNKDFKDAVDDAFRKGFQFRGIKPAEQLAKHIDHALRKGKGKLDQAAFMKELEASLELHRYSSDKDVFRAFYHRALAKRLLGDRSASTDDEKAVLQKLKKEYDVEFGLAEGMFNDLDISKGFTAEYHKVNKEGKPMMSATVLTQSAWPFTSRALETKGDKPGNDMEVDSAPVKYKNSVSDPVLPEAMQAEVNSFIKFYNSKFNGRTLWWDHRHGTCVMNATFGEGSHELSVSLYQAVVLLVFNEGDEYTYEAIQHHTKMGDVDLRRTLQSLSLGKKKVLKKHSQGKEVLDDDVFSFNAAFKDDKKKVHIPSIQIKETQAETQKTNEMVEGDRNHYLDACIVRIMKGKKKLHYEELKIATIEGVKSHFSPDIGIIKKRVEALVGQEYLMRDEKDKNVYHYVA